MANSNPLQSAVAMATGVHGRIVEPLGRWRVTGKHVLMVLIGSFIAWPFLENTTFGLAIESFLVTMVIASAVLAVGGNRSTFLFSLSLAIPGVAAKWLNHSRPDLAPAELYLSFAIVTVGFVAWKFLRFIMQARRVDSNVMCTGIAAFLLLALLWSFLYQLVDRQVPGSFVCTVGSQPAREMKGMFAVYFSLVTLCTVGFGDIVPATDIARMCAMLEGATGVFFVAVLISRLVSLYTVEQQDQPGGNTSPEKPPQV